MNLPPEMLTRPEAAYKVAFDLNVSHMLIERGDTCVWITWNRITGEACMVITPKMARLSHERAVPCVIPLSRAWIWDETIGDEIQVMESASLFCANLGFNPYNRKNVFKIISIVRDSLPDLLTCPPIPRQDQEIAADALITDNATGEVTHKEIKDHA